jgi:hypothetical protein
VGFIMLKILKPVIDFSSELKMTQEKIEGGKQNVCKTGPSTTALGEQKHEHLRPSQRGKRTPLLARTTLLVLRSAGAAGIEVCADDQRICDSSVERTEERKVYEVQGLAEEPGRR